MKRHSLLLFLALSLGPWLGAQNYKDMMGDIHYNVKDVIQAAEKHFETHDKGQGSGWKGYQRWRWINEERFYPTGDRSQFNPAIASEEMQKFYQTEPLHKTSGPADEYWRYLGPDYSNDLLPPSWAAGVGRIETVWAGFASTDTIFLGSRSGGFWKSLDGGNNWRSTTQHLPALGVVDIEVRPDRKNEVFLVSRHGTGYSLGLMKSNDYGETWNTTSLSFTVNNYRILRGMVIPPTAPDTMYVYANNGLHRSDDGGGTWNRVFNTNIRAFEVKPGTANVCYAVFNNQNNDLNVSTDYGQTWTTVSTITANAGRTPRLAVTPVNPDVIYFASSSGIWKSSDTGQNFNYQGPDISNSGLMCFGVSDTDEDKVVIGSLDHYISNDGGQNFTNFAGWVNYNAANYLHADGRILRSWNGVMYLGTDGFLGRSTDGGSTWTKVNEIGTGLREFYRIGSSPMRYDLANGGSQDNGTSMMIGFDWYEWIGADGMECHYDRNNPEISFGTIQFGALRRTTQFGQNSNGIAPDNNGEWVTPSVIDPNNDNTLFIAFDTLYKSNDNGDTWEFMSSFSGLGNMRQLAIAESDSNVLYIARNNVIYRSDNNGLNWQNIGIGLPNRNITRIAVHPEDADRVAVCYSGYNSVEKVFHSSNGGSNWSNLSLNLPNIPVNVVAYENSDDHRLYAGMDVGVYYVDDNASAWTLYDDSLPAVRVNDLEILEGMNMLRAGTWGRGLWEAPLPGRSDAPQIVRIDIDPAQVENRPHQRDSVNIATVVKSTSLLTSVKLWWGLDPNTYTNSIPMSVIQGDSFKTDYGIPPHPVGTQVYFKILAVDNTADSTWSDKIMYRVKKGQICTASGSPGTGFDYIREVTIDTLYNFSSQEFYGDFRHLTVPVKQDSSYDLIVALAASFPPDTMYAWADWNHNYSFESTERIPMSAINSSHTSTGTLVVPANATLDTITLRVRNIYSSSPISDPCDDYFGEVEDYSLIVYNDSVLTSRTPVADGFELFPNPTGTSLTLRSMALPLQGEVEVYDLRGRVLLSRSLASPLKEVTLDVSALPEGIYILRTAAGHSFRFSVQR